jgi:hypothetical protein
VGPRAGLDNLEKRKFLILPGLEIRPLGRPARSQSLDQLVPVVTSKEVDGIFETLYESLNFSLTVLKLCVSVSSQKIRNYTRSIFGCKSEMCLTCEICN